MIFEALSCIQRQLSPHAKTEIASIGEIISGNGTNPDDATEIILSLINIEENRISRGPRNNFKSGIDVVVKNPAVHLNLTLLFTAVKAPNAYQTALQSLQHTVQFFQSKYVFDHTNTPLIDLDGKIEKLILEMVSINIEQLNQLWAILGGRYQPSVIYRARMITIDTEEGAPGHLITEIDSRYFKI